VKLVLSVLVAALFLELGHKAIGVLHLLFGVVQLGLGGPHPAQGRSALQRQQHPLPLPLPTLNTTN
jgi:hypothetical protein